MRVLSHECKSVNQYGCLQVINAWHQIKRFSVHLNSSFVLTMDSFYFRYMSGNNNWQLNQRHLPAMMAPKRTSSTKRILRCDSNNSDDPPENTKENHALKSTTAASPNYSVSYNSRERTKFTRLLMIITLVCLLLLVGIVLLITSQVMKTASW